MTSVTATAMRLLLPRSARAAAARRATLTPESMLHPAREVRSSLRRTAAARQAADCVDDAEANRAMLRKRLRSACITMAICIAFLIIFPVAAWSAPQDDKQVDSLIQLALYLGALSLVPFAVMTLTSFLRIVVVLSFLRSGLGAQNVPPNIVIIALALFLSLFVMGPTIDKINEEALQPFQANEIPFNVAVTNATGPLKEFMVLQISGSTSRDEIRTFYRMALEQKPVLCTDKDINMTTFATKNCLITNDQYKALGNDAPKTLPLRIIIPAFIIGELEKAFIMGFAVLLPFLVIDMVISNILLSLGMFMLPPVVISLPFKILLFVIAGGWSMVVRFIVEGFRYT